MKPANFSYRRPASLDEAMTILQDGDGAAMPIAGGQSLLVIMGLRMTMIDQLVDITRLPDLSAIEQHADRVVLGALTTHARIEDRKIPDPAGGLMARVASKIAYRAVRNLGTIGGSVALADPAADWPACLIAMGAIVNIAGPDGTRQQAVEDFVQGAYETTLRPGEIVVNFELPRLPKARWGTSKVTRKSGAFADSMAVFVESDGSARAALTGTSSHARLLPRTSAYARDHAEVDIAELQSVIRGDLAELVSDADDYQLRCHIATVSRAICEARTQ